MRRKIHPLGGTEMEVLRHVWSLKEASARTVYERIRKTRPTAYTTVMTVMKNLAKKGYLQYRKEGNAYVYAAARPPEEVRSSLLSGFVSQVFGGDAASLVQTLVQQETLTLEQRARVERLLHQLGDDE